MNLKERLIRQLREEVADIEGGKYVDDIYLSNYDGCIPESWIGDDLMGDIQDKFRYPVNAVRNVLKKEIKIPFNWLLVDPSYEDSTFVTVIVDKEKKVIFFDYWKAWRFVFENEEELGEELVRIYNEMKRNTENL